MPRLESIMNRQPVTLRAHDSINLTTGVVTRSDSRELLPCGHGLIHQGSSGECLRCFATANVEDLGHEDRLRNRNLRGLRANYLVTLQLMIENDQSIPAYSDLHFTGLCGICLTDQGDLASHWSTPCEPQA
jgi:hypothetical protein